MDTASWNEWALLGGAIALTCLNVYQWGQANTDRGWLRDVDPNDEAGLATAFFLAFKAAMRLGIDVSYIGIAIRALIVPPGVQLAGLLGAIPQVTDWTALGMVFLCISSGADIVHRRKMSAMAIKRRGGRKNPVEA